MNTFCYRNLTDFKFRLDTMEYQLCCHTPSRPIEKSLFQSTWVKTRLEDHTSNVRNSDCNYCWKLEDKNIISPRQFTTTPVVSVEIVLDNLCNMSCLYCNPASSSVWAEKLKDKNWIKGYDTEYNTLERQKIIFDWIETITKDSIQIRISGGEPTLNPKLFTILDRIKKPGTTVIINTNLNTTDIMMNKLIEYINKMTNNNINFFIRCSLDGVGDQNDWQRDGSNWKKVEANLKKYLETDARIGIFTTITVLTLEALKPLCEWVLEESYQNNNKIRMHRGVIVEDNPNINIKSWLGLFAKEFESILKLAEDKLIFDELFYKQVLSWSKLIDNIPTSYEKNELINWLDNQAIFHKKNDWRHIYPKIAKYCET